MKRRRLHSVGPQDNECDDVQEVQLPPETSAQPPREDLNPIMTGLYPEVYNQPGASLTNPDPNISEGPLIDRVQPLPTALKAQRLGFQPASGVGTLFELPPGDAGAGQSCFRRIQVFASLTNNIAAGGVTADFPYNQSVGLGTQRSSDTRPRYWHVSFFSLGVFRDSAALTGPLSEPEITRDPFVGNSGTGLASSAVPYVPRISPLKGRVLIQDESGGRFIDVDVLGNRSFNVYAFAVTVFVLMPDNAYEVNFQNPSMNGDRAGLLLDAMFAARVVPIVLNETQNVDLDTQTVGLSGGGGTTTFVPIPPGARTVQVINHSSAAAAQLYELFFDVGVPAGSTAIGDMGVIVLDPVTFRTDAIRIPNSTQIRIEGLAGSGATRLSFIFGVEAQ